MTDVLEDLRILYVEIHPGMLAERGHDAAALRRHLETLGFAVEELVEHKPQQIVRCTR
jgi:hypothetical protein